MLFLCHVWIVDMSWKNGKNCCYITKTFNTQILKTAIYSVWEDKTVYILPFSDFIWWERLVHYWTILYVWRENGSSFKVTHFIISLSHYLSLIWVQIKGPSSSSTHYLIISLWTGVFAHLSVWKWPLYSCARARL